MTRLILSFVTVLFVSVPAFAQAVSPVATSDSLVNGGKWEVRSKVEKLPEGVDEAFVLVNAQDACIVAFVNEEHGNYVAFSVGKRSKAVRISRTGDKITYLDMDYSGHEIDKNDPAFAYCASQIMAATEFAPKFRARFHGFAGIK